MFGVDAPRRSALRHRQWFAPSPCTRVQQSVGPLELSGQCSASWRAMTSRHAIALANDTPFGLSAALFTRDLASALHYVRQIEAGLVRVNGDTTGVDPHAPFGGVKGSSSGSREQGRAAREFYTEVRTIQIQP